MSDSKQKNYYELLGVSFYASTDDIHLAAEGALRRVEVLAGAPKDEAQAAEIEKEKHQIVTAYATLKDAQKRTQYNASLTAKISEAARQAKEASAQSVAATPGTSAVANTQGATSTASQQYEAVDIRESIRKRREEGETLPLLHESFSNEYAPLDVRFVAWVLDVTIMLLATFAVITFMGKTRGIGALYDNKTVYLLIAVYGLYYVVCEASPWRATLGKWWMGLCVYRADGETPVGVGRALLRYVLRFLGSCTFLIGYITALFTDRKQALHDLASNTVVYRRQPQPAKWVTISIYSAILACFLCMKLLFALSGNYAGAYREAAREFAKDEKVDSSRASPEIDEVNSVYQLSLHFQNTMRAFRLTNRRWPEPAEREQIIAQSAYASRLKEHNVIIFPGGMYALSLGATQYGTARMLFVLNPRDAEVSWICSPINIADIEQIPHCEA